MLVSGRTAFFTVRVSCSTTSSIRQGNNMDMELRVRNHDIGLFLPTFQERINGTLPVAESLTNARIAADACAAPALEGHVSATPRYLGTEEARAALSRVEEEARGQSAEIVEIHSGLNELRVARLLGLLE
jgi:hypothetical protein